jgi:hypothetical protein
MIALLFIFLVEKKKYIDITSLEYQAQHATGASIPVT